MVKWRKRKSHCWPWAVTVSARTLIVGVSCIGRGVLHALDAIVLLTELVVSVFERKQIGCRPSARLIEFLR